MNAQDVFDVVVTHLYRQGRRATSNEVCVYRADDGSSCAVGCLIPDEAYTPDLEGSNALLLADAAKLPQFLMPHTQLLFALQCAHDHSIAAPTLERRLRELAAACGLTYRAEHYPPVPAGWA